MKCHIYDTMKMYWGMEVKLHTVDIGIRKRWMVRCVLVRFCSRFPWYRGLSSLRVWNWCQAGWSLLMSGIQHLSSPLSVTSVVISDAVYVFINFSDSLGGRFESWPRNWISWYFAVILFTTSRHMLSQYLRLFHSYFLLYPFQFII